VFANEVLKFQDETGALASRLLVFRMRQLFMPGEGQDPDLTEKLLAERSGILNLALAALDRVRETGRLIQPTSGLERGERFTDQASHAKRFVAARCEVGPQVWVPLQRVYRAWRAWCAEVGITFVWTDNVFSEKLCSAFPTVNRSRPRIWPDGTRHDRGDDKGRPVVLFGIGLRDKAGTPAGTLEQVLQVPRPGRI
jgi:putative DNA primase/helicase